jgi:GT2 family glycosyltransferase
MIDVSVIIVTFNSEKHIGACLSSIMNHSSQYSYEVIVVDNASVDQTVEIVLGFKNVIFQGNQFNVGFSKANNQGIKAAQGKYLLILNPDVRVNDFCMDELIASLEDEPSRAIVSPKLVYSNGEIQESARRFPNLFVQLISRLPVFNRFFQKQYEQYLMRDWNHLSHRNVDWVIGAAMLGRKKDIKQVGMFDESFFLYCEDIDLCYRFSKQGFTIYYLSSTVLLHDYQQASSKKLSKLTLIHLKSIFTFYKKYPELMFRRIGGD